MWWQWWQEALVPSLPGHHLHQGLMDTVPGHYDSIRAILDELNCQAHGHIQSDIRIVAFRQWLVQCFRPGLQHCMTQVVLIQCMTAVSAAGVTRWGDSAHQMGQHSLQGPILSQAGGDGQSVCSLLPGCRYPRGGQHQELEFKHAHMIKTYGSGQKIPFKGGICSVKLLLMG